MGFTDIEQEIMDLIDDFEYHIYRNKKDLSRETIEDIINFDMKIILVGTKYVFDYPLCNIALATGLEGNDNFIFEDHKERDYYIKERGRIENYRVVEKLVRQAFDELLKVYPGVTHFKDWLNPFDAELILYEEMKANREKLTTIEECKAAFECDKLMDDFAYLVHSMGNVMLVPKGINNGQYVKPRAYMDLMLHYIYLYYNESDEDKQVELIKGFVSQSLNRYSQEKAINAYDKYLMRFNNWAEFVELNLYQDYLENPEDVNSKPKALWKDHLTFSQSGVFDPENEEPMNPIPSNPIELRDYMDAVNKIIKKRALRMLKAMYNRSEATMDECDRMIAKLSR